MALDALRTFLVVARLHSISEAAVTMGVTQPTVSRRVRGLEEKLGRALLEPGKKPIRLTPAGVAAATALETLLQTVDQMQIGVRERSPVRLAADAVLVANELVDAVGLWRTVFPNCQLYIETTAGAAVMDRLRDGSLDFWVTTADLSSVPASGFQVEMLGQAAPMLLIPVGHALGTLQSVSLDDLLVFPLIVLRHPSDLVLLHRSPLQILRARAAESGVECNVLMEVESTEALIRCVQDGIAISILSASRTWNPKDRQLRTVDLSHLFPVTVTGVVTLDRHRLSVEAETLLRMLRTTLRLGSRSN